jgi:four helix bundle protein
MKYSRFEDLPVWQSAIEFVLKVFEFTNKADLRGLGDTRNQIERSALSISNSIAEGFERGTTKDLIHFLYIARGSAGESRSMLRICEQLSQFKNFKSEISNLIGQAVGISKQLHGWIDSLKNTEIKGVKFLNDKTRKNYEQRKELDEFDLEMKKYRDDLHAMLIKREEEAARKRKSENEYETK